MPDFLQDMKLKLDPAFMPPEADRGPLPPMVPPLRLGPPPAQGSGFDPRSLDLPPHLSLPPPDLSQSPPPDLFSNYAEPSPGQTAMGAINGAVQGLGNGPGMQIDKNGVGATVDDWKLRFMPYVPYLNEP
jgi:hypothetical protein